MKPIQPTVSRAEQAYQAIVDEICEGALTAGTHLVQEALAERLGVSRQPIQQAMALLKADGLAIEAEGRGLIVAPLDVGTMRQRYEVRMALDMLAARLAAERAGGSPELAADIARRGGTIVKFGMQAVEAGSIKRMVRHDVEFHAFIYEVSGNPFVAFTAEPHWRYLRRVMSEVLRHAEPGPAIWRQHEEILAAVVAGDGAAAESLARRHVERAAERLGAATLLALAEDDSRSEPASARSAARRQAGRRGE